MARASRKVAVIVAVAAFAAAAFLFLRYQQTAQKPIDLAEGAARASGEVRDALGEPLRFGRIPQVKVRGPNAHAVIRVHGSRGEGLLIEWAQQNAGRWNLCSLLFRDESTTTDVILVSRAGSGCARE